MPLARPLCPECDDGPELEFEPPLALVCPDCSYRWDY